MTRYLSVCSGIEAATVAWHHMGWQPVAFSDIEAFPSAVLAHHYPHVPNLGDMTKFEEWNLEPVDLLVGGTPCQSFSVAGLRKGLADPRGNLMLTFLAIAQRQRPRWIVWENVPGVLSSSGGRDFGTFLGALGELGYGFAYRVLDAQWFGVAQRRRRVFVVGCLGDWQRPAQVLFESESVSRHPAPSREAGQEVAGTIAARFGISRNNHEELAWPAEIASTLNASFGDKQGLEDQHALSGAPLFVPGKIGTITARMFNALGARDVEEGALLPVAQPITQFGEIAGSLTARHDSSPCADRGQNVVAQPVAFHHNAQASQLPTDARDTSISDSLTVSQQAAVALPVATAMQVRRLTPVECERLQGFPDGYTNIPWRKKPESPDGPRYKALGNSMAVPVMRWIGERINKVDK
jgi:DNA (cytosine-5)-methyltransferase 1